MLSCIFIANSHDKNDERMIQKMEYAKLLDLILTGHPLKGQENQSTTEPGKIRDFVTSFQEKCVFKKLSDYGYAKQFFSKTAFIQNIQKELPAIRPPKELLTMLLCEHGLLFESDFTYYTAPEDDIPFDDFITNQHYYDDYPKEMYEAAKHILDSFYEDVQKNKALQDTLNNE